VLSAGTKGWLKRWDGRDGRPAGEWRLVPPGVGLAAAQFSGDGSGLAVARMDGLFDVWDVPARQVRRRFHLPDVDAFGFGILAYARDGDTLAVAPAMGQLAVWDVDSGERRLSLPADATRWGRMALSPDGDRLARS